MNKLDLNSMGIKAPSELIQLNTVLKLYLIAKNELSNEKLQAAKYGFYTEYKRVLHSLNITTSQYEVLLQSAIILLEI